MERPNLYNPFPEIEKLKEVIPDTGIAFHGTTRENAEKILAEGFSINHPYRIKHLNYMHFFYIPPRGSGYSNTYSSYEGFAETLSWAHLRGNVHEPNKLHQQAIVLFQPNLAESEVIVSDEPEKRFEKGHPIWIRTQKNKRT